MDELKHSIKFIPAYADEKSTHGVDILFLCQGPKGAVAFQVSTYWHTKEVMNGWGTHKAQYPSCLYIPEPGCFSIAWHSYIRPDKTNKYSSSNFDCGSCEWLDGAPCYSTASSCADGVFSRLIAEGHRGVQDELEKQYEKRFGHLTLAEARGEDEGGDD